MDLFLDTFFPFSLVPLEEHRRRSCSSGGQSCIPMALGKNHEKPCTAPLALAFAASFGVLDGEIRHIWWDAKSSLSEYTRIAQNCIRMATRLV